MPSQPPVRIEIDLHAEMPIDLLQGFLQHIRDFEIKHHEEMHLGIVGGSPEISTEEIIKIIRSIKPPFPVEREYKFGD